LASIKLHKKLDFKYWGSGEKKSRWTFSNSKVCS